MKMKKRAATPIGIAIHVDGQSPIFGESTTHVLVDDEAGGLYIVLRQMHDDIKPGEVRLDMDELEEVVRAARRLMKAQPLEVAD